MYQVQIQIYVTDIFEKRTNGVALVFTSKYDTESRDFLDQKEVNTSVEDDTIHHKAEQRVAEGCDINDLCF